MLRAIPRYGTRVIPNTEQTIAELRERGELVQGPHLARFERAFAAHVGASHAVSASYGRIAFYDLIHALRLPRGSEIILPALTFWVIPELARAAGLIPVFADVDPHTFTLDPAAFERAITPRTSAVVPTHLYGLACDMDAILGLARRHGLAVIEDCAHALGATWRGRQVGALGDAGFFSFQLLKPLNTYGGGMAVTNNPAVAQRLMARVEEDPWPDEARVTRRLLVGRIQRIAIRPRVFSTSLFPFLYAASYTRTNPDVYLWEKIRPLTPLPEAYRERYSNVQAALGLEGLRHIESWTSAAADHARALDEALDGTGIERPKVPKNGTHVYYQYAVYAPRRDAVVRQCIRRGVDVETLHVDVCTRVPLFGNRPPAPGADQAATSIQLPVYSSLSMEDVGRVASVVREAVRSA
jgi:perosamine synthetase